MDIYGPRSINVCILALYGKSVVAPWSKGMTVVCFYQLRCGVGFLLSFTLQLTLYLSLCYVTGPSWPWGATLLMLI